MNTDVNIQIGNFEELQAPAKSNSLDAVTSLTYRVTKCFILTSAIVYGLLCLMFLLFQNRLIFMPTYQVSQVPVQAAHSFANLVVTSHSGHSISAWFIPAENNIGTVLYCRGNKGNMSDDMHVAETWRKLGYNVVLFDYQGYGISTGEPSELNCYDDAESMYNWLRNNRLMNKKIIIHGKNIGAAVAAKLAKENGCDGLVLESPLTSIKDLGKQRFPFIPGFLYYNDFPTSEYVKNVEAPLLVMHSPSDETVPFSMGQKVFDSATGHKNFFSLEGDHYESISHTPGYLRALQTFSGSLNN